MNPTPLSFLGSLGGKRMLICGIGIEAVAFTLAGADVYGFDGSVSQVEAVKDLARGLALRDRIHLQTGAMNRWPIQIASLIWPSERRLRRMLISNRA